MTLYYIRKKIDNMRILDPMLAFRSSRGKSAEPAPIVMIPAHLAYQLGSLPSACASEQRATCTVAAHQRVRKALAQQEKGENSTASRRELC